MTDLNDQTAEQTSLTSAKRPTLFRRAWRADVTLLLILVLLVGAYFRFLNVDWDEGEHLHPDERYMTIVTGAIRTPGPADDFQDPPAGCDDWGGYFDSYCSPLNPYNRGQGNYAYGTLPLFLTRTAGEWLNGACVDPANPDAIPPAPLRWIAGALFDDAEGCVGDRFTDYGHVHLLGRMLAALADLSAVLFIFLIGRRLYGQWVGLLAAALYALAVLPIQQSHFYTVDAFAGGLIAFAGYFAVRGSQEGGWRDFTLAGLGFGLALASKVSVWPFAAIIALAALLYYVHSGRREEKTRERDRGRGRVLTGLVILLGIIFSLLIVTIALLGIWSAVKLTFFLAVVLLFLGGAAFYVLRPGDGAAREGISVDGALLRLLAAGLVAFLAFRVAQPYAFVGTGFDVEQWQAPEYDWLRANVPDLWHTLEDKTPEPLRSLLLPDPRFIGALGSVNKQLTGEQDVPWGHQWTNRLPFVFPWVNMVVWGMGLPLGLMAWAGWGVAAWELWRGKRRRQHFIPWAWATLLFFYQGTQWVKSIRYMLSTYPFMILLAAWLLVRLFRGRWSVTSGKWLVASGKRRTAWIRGLPLAVILVGTLLWAWGFTRIYAHPVTRNAASRWMTENIPTAATLHYEVNGETKTQFLRIPAPYNYRENGVAHLVPFRMPEDGTIKGITFNHLSDPDQDAAPERFQVALSTDVEGQQILAQVEQSLQLESISNPLDEPHHFELDRVFLEGEREYYLVTQTTAGAPVQLDTTIIANEYPDDSLPNRVDGRDPFGGTYRGLQSSGDGKTHWDLDENASKLAQALEWLDEADWIALSSNRGYASIPRLPSRYPLAMEYYRALFAEELGFELVASFASYPTIGPFQFPDQETPFPPDEPTRVEMELGEISIHLPPAEEAFSVYDHPQVFLFRKTEAYSRQRVKEVLGDVNLNQVVWQKPTEATLAPTALMLTQEEWETQRQGGTWSDIFDADWLNDAPWLSVVVWWLLMQALGLVAFPLLFVAAPGLRDRGWPLAKTLGLLLLATLVWWAGSSKLLPYSRPVIFAALLLLAGIGGALTRWRWQELKAWAIRERRVILISELVFNGLFLLFLLIRYGNPDLWHPVMGGERPMDFAYLNAVVKSTYFPPYDPWFAGGYMNYYYFGFVIVGTPIKLLGLLPEIAYNLALPTFFALTGAGAFSVAYNLVGRRKSETTPPRTTGHAIRNTHHASPVAALRGPKSRTTSSKARRGTRRAIIAGLIAALFVMLLGNLGEVGLVVDGLQELGQRDFQFESTIPGLEPLVFSARGLFKSVVGGEPLPWRPEWPYWNASRVIPHPQGEAPPITEFPFFTFLYSDLHAHLLVLPLTLLALALALNWALDAEFWWLHARGSILRRRRRFTVVLGLILGGIVIGSLRPTNTWDYVTYLCLPLLTLILGYVVHRPGLQNLRPSLATLRDGIAAVGGRFVALAALSYIFFLPYITHYATAYSSVELWKGSKTPFGAYFVVHGLFLFPILTWLLLKSWGWLRAQLPARRPRAVVATSAATTESVTPAGNPSDAIEGKAPRPPRNAYFVPSAVTILLLVTLFAVVAGYSVALIVLPFGGLALLLLLRRESRLATRLIALLVGTGLALTLLVELVVLKGDISRMNTVFKFYLQVWVLFGISASVCLTWLLRRRETSRERASEPAAQAWRIWTGVVALLIGLAALYPVLATRAKINDRWTREIGPGLDSLEWMTVATDFKSGPGAPAGSSFPLKWDYQALTWLRQTVEGSPVVAEGAQAQPYRSLRARVATYTGLPIIIGYPWHQKQQRSFLTADLVGKRERDVNELYNTPDPLRAQELLDRYEVRYVYLGELERILYEPIGVEKFAQMADMGLLRIAYANEGVTIYQVVQ